MAEHPAFESPVTAPYGRGTRLPAHAGGPDADVLLTLCDVSSLAKTVVRAGWGTVAAGWPAVRFGTSRTEGEVLIVGQRPDEWILLGPADAAQALLDRLDRSGHITVIDYTHSRALFRLTGRDSASVLDKLCNLDWSDHMTPDGAAVSGSIARVTCDIVRHDQGKTRSYLISGDRSYGQYLFDCLLDAGQEFGIVPRVGPGLAG